MVVIVVMGSIGCLARWAIEEIVERKSLTRRPYATMLVNALGALITGFVVVASYHISANSAEPGVVTSLHSVAYGSRGISVAAPWLLTGFCGGFTTFSSAIAIPYLDFRSGRRARGIYLVALTPILCLVGYLIGEWSTHALF